MPSLQAGRLYRYDGSHQLENASPDQLLFHSQHARLTSLNAYLVINDGSRAGSRLILRSDGPNLIGRGLECRIVLTDPRCSRVHAAVEFRENEWWIDDADSRNGTYVNGQKIDSAQLIDGNFLRVGDTEFTFRLDSSPEDFPTKTSLHETIVHNEAIKSDDTGDFALTSIRKAEGGEDLFVLFQLSVRLLSCNDPDEVVKNSLDLLQQRTNASVVSFLWLSDDGQLKPKVVFPPEAADRIELSEPLTDLVSRQQHAVRVDLKGSVSEEYFADAICVPLVYQSKTRGAVHLFRERGHFRNNDYQIARSLANILVRSLVRAREQAAMAADQSRLRHEIADTGELIGSSKPMQELKSKIARVARASGCVLVRGESGAGKELIARALHQASPRSDRPMLSVNCAAIPSELMESQLFGHKKGAFTSADSDHIGWFEQADSGTLFLDEVGELNLEGQAKLLRILEGHPFLPVGGTEEIKVDVRVIAATNRDLSEYVAEKRFREDLYYRLSVFELYAPPLRERGTDIELLLNHFLEHFRTQHGRPELSLSDDAKARLLSYQWPGNVRQLRNVVDSAVVMAEGSTIEPDDLGLRQPGSGELESLRIDHWERKLIQEALGRADNNVPAAAKMLGISRATLYRKIDEYGITR